MTQIAVLSLMLFLTACSHYQKIEQVQSKTNPASQSKNRYNQGDIVFDSKRKEARSSAVELTNFSNKKPLSAVIPKVEEEKIIPKSIVTNNKKNAPSKPSLWSQFIDIFTPEKVKPWQKSILAKATMKPGGLTPASEKFNQKIYSSKESSRGGLGVAGGGCGCN
ncbi:DUF4266 domain-containing protein [Pseudomonas sp. HK3]